MARPAISALARLLLAVAISCTACVTITQKEIDESQTQYDIGVNEMTNGRFETALDAFQRSLGYNPNFADAHMGLGLLWWRKGRIEGLQEDYAKARSELERAVELRPTFSDAWNNLGALCIERKDYARAVEAFRHALADPIYKTPFVARSNLGWVYHLQGNDKEAMAQIRESLITEPTYCVGHRQLASLLDAMNRSDEAAREWGEFMKYCPEDPDALYHDGRRHLDAGEVDQAARSFLRCQLEAEKINPSHTLIVACEKAQLALPPIPPEEVMRIRKEVSPLSVPPDASGHDISTEGSH